MRGDRCVKKWFNSFGLELLILWTFNCWYLAFLRDNVLILKNSSNSVTMHLKRLKVLRKTKPYLNFSIVSFAVYLSVCHAHLFRKMFYLLQPNLFQTLPRLCYFSRLNVQFGWSSEALKSLYSVSSHRCFDWLLVVSHQLWVLISATLAIFPRSVRPHVDR